MDMLSHRGTGAHSMQQTVYAERETMIARGDLFSASLDPVVGSEQGGVRPVLVIQNDVGNRHSPTVIVLAITGQVNKARLPTHVPVPAGANGLQKDSVILAEQIRTLERTLGVTLFTRVGRGVVPTAAGEQLREHAERTIAAAEEARRAEERRLAEARRAASAAKTS